MINIQNIHSDCQLLIDEFVMDTIEERYKIIYTEMQEFFKTTSFDDILGGTHMEVLIVTFAECMILGVSYIIMRKRQKKKSQKEKILLHDFFEKEINSIENWELAGVGNYMNSDNEFIHAVRKINLPSDVRIIIYD